MLSGGCLRWKNMECLVGGIAARQHATVCVSQASRNERGHERLAAGPRSVASAALLRPICRQQRQRSAPRHSALGILAVREGGTVTDRPDTITKPSPGRESEFDLGREPSAAAAPACERLLVQNWPMHAICADARPTLLRRRQEHKKKPPMYKVLLHNDSTCDPKLIFSCFAVVSR